MAAYNAGPAIAEQLRKKAEQEGLDPNVRFNNVEIAATQQIGPETVTYVTSTNTKSDIKWLLRPSHQESERPAEPSYHRRLI